MCGNQLTALDPTIGDLKSLKELDLSSNQITTLPPSFTSLASLVQLNLGKGSVNASATICTCVLLCPALGLKSTLLNGSVCG